VAAFAAISLPACAFAAILPAFAPGLARRMVSPRLFAVLALAAGASCVVQSLATLLRSFKREPFLLLSVVSAGLTLAMAALTASRWGSSGAALSYLGVSMFVTLPSALIVFARRRRGYLSKPAPAVSETGTGPDGRRERRLAPGIT
jgi:O-antigen/teichoic acid export membrane protein